MTSPQIASEIATRMDRHTELAGQHHSRRVASTQASIPSWFPLPAEDPRCVDLRAEIDVLKQQALALRPVDCSSQPIGWFKTHEPVWMREGSPVWAMESVPASSVNDYIPRAIALALSKCAVDVEQVVVSESITIALPPSAVRDEDSGNAHLQTLADPTHRVAFSATRIGAEQTWVLMLAHVAELSSEKVVMIM